MSLSSSLTISLVDGVSGPAQRASDALRHIEKSAKSLGDSKNFGWGKSFQKEIDRLKLTPAVYDRVARSWEALNTSLKSGGPMKASAYFGAIDQWKMKTLSSLRSVRSEYEGLGNVMARIGKIATVIGGSYAARSVATYVAKQGAENARESSRDYLAGLTAEETGRIGARSLTLSGQYPSVDVASMHARIREVATAFRSVDTALAMSEDVAKASVVLQSLKGKERAGDELARFFKAVNTVGYTDPILIREVLDGYLRALATEGRDMDMGSILQMVRQSRAAGAALSPKFLMTIAPQLGQDMGDSQVGTALASGLSQVVGGRATKTSKTEMKKYGLRDKKGKLVDQDLFLSNPFDWMNQVMVPAFKKRGMNVDDTLAVSSVMQKIFSNRTVADIFTKMMTQRTQYEAGADWYNNRAKGINAAKPLGTLDPFVAFEGFLAQFRNFAASLAGPLIEPAVTGLNALTGAIVALTKAASENPKIALGLDALGLAGGAAGVYGGWKGVQKLFGRGASSASSKLLLSGESVASTGWLARIMPWLGGIGTAATVASLSGDAGPFDSMRNMPGDYTLRSDRKFGKAPSTWDSKRFTRQPYDKRLPGVDPFNFGDMAPVGEAGAAGEASGSAFREKLNAELEAAKSDLARHVQEMLNLLNFNASPTITPRINAPAGGVPGKSSAKDASIKLGRLVDDTLRGNFLDHEFA